mgnify:CR=1 FL=1
MLYRTTLSSPLGPLMLAGDEGHLTGLWMEGQKYFAAHLPPAVPVRDDLPLFSQAANWLARYFAGAAPDPAALPLAPAGSDFQKMVWAKLLAIPYGQTTTYGAIARQLAAETGRSMASQAVGGAVGHNPISIIIPCHRVVGATGSLTGYAGGLDKKRWLLAHEGVDLSKFSTPGGPNR